MQRNYRLATGIVLLITTTILVDTAFAQGGPGYGRRWRGGRGSGPGGGGDTTMGEDHRVFQYLLSQHEKIRRQITEIDGGVETLTESDDPEVTKKIQEHVTGMYQRVKQNRPIHMRDPLFAEIFQHASKIKMTHENTEHGVRVRETSDDPYVVKLIQAHAKVVSLFVERGHTEVRRNHAVPTGIADSAPEFAQPVCNSECGNCPAEACPVTPQESGDSQH